MEFRTYVLRRVILLFFILLGVSILVFVLAVMVPSDPAYLWSGSQVPNEQELEQIREQYHLRDPWYVQYLWYLWRILHGDLGTSPVRRVPVATELMTYLPPSVELGTFALLLSIAIGLPIGIISATRKDTAWDHAGRLLALGQVSLPAFWIGLIFQLVFYYNLRLVADPGGFVSDAVLSAHPLTRITGFMTIDSLLTGNWAVLASALQHLVLPGLVMSFYSTALIARISRASMMEAMNQDYIRTARAFGLSERVVIYKLALKNALIPTTTAIGLAVGWLLTGSVVVETIFYWPGIGRFAVDSIQNFDFPGLIGFVLLAGLIYGVANVIVDVVYGFLDPRIRQG
ncbi:MAG: ABC transporter permease [Candidatus Bathyarchaeia archaeon]